MYQAKKCDTKNQMLFVSMMKAGMMLILILSGIIKTADAAYCNLGRGTSPTSVTIPVLANNISVMPSTPVGRVIYSQTFVPTFSGLKSFDCLQDVGSTVTYVQRWVTTSTPSGGVAHNLGSSLDQVYNTNIPGIGVAVVRNGRTTGFRGGLSVPRVITSDTRTCSSSAGITQCSKLNPVLAGEEATLELILVKTGNIPSSISNVVLASSFPAFAFEVGSPQIRVLQSLRFNFSGQINIVSKTCQTSDVEVELDQHQQSDFIGVGTTTAWKVFNITLTDCPAFYGNYTRDSMLPGTVTWNEKGASSVGATTYKNYINYTLNSINPLVLLSNGLNGISLDTGVGKATGLAIEISAVNRFPSSINYGAATNSSLSLTTTNGASYTIPFRARYHQTASTVTPGDANASVEFVINYQ